MERDANYTAVGAFVILVTVMAALFVYWYSEGRERRSYTTYEIYFQGSVTGLSEGGSVRYMGVEVGRIRRIRLDRRSADRVQVIAQIDEAAPISEQTAAELSLLSVATGLLYIDLRQNTTGREVLAPVPSENYPVINTVRSRIDAFLESLPDITISAADLMERAQQIFSPQNTESLADMIQNLHATSEALPATMQRVDALIDELGRTSRSVRQLAASVETSTGEITPQVRQLAEKLGATAAHLEQTSSSIEKFVEDNSASIGGFTRDGLPQLQRMIGEASDAAAEFRELSRSLKEDPSQLIYRPTRRGVEVPR